MEILISIKYFILRTVKKTFLVLVLMHMIFFIIMFFVLEKTSRVNPEVTSLMLYRKHVCGHAVKPVRFVPLDKIPSDIIKMAIATEDYRFYTHPGIDIEAIKRAYVINRKVGYHMYGGSTITQQLSRTLFLMPKKLLIRKYAEVLISLEMEMLLSKERILELYLNYCEWGKGIFGVARASEHYYRKDPDRLTIDQTARLITILANPISYGPYTFHRKIFLANRYYIIKFRYYTYLKFHDLALR